MDTSLKLKHHAAIFFSYLALAIALTYPLAFRLTTHIPVFDQLLGSDARSADPWNFLWGLWVTKCSLLEHGRFPLWTNEIFYPRGADLWCAIWAAIPLLLALPLASLIGRVAAYNVAILGSLAMAGYSAFLLVRHLTQNGKAAFVAGVIFAFCPYHMAQASYNLILLASAVWVPLYILALIKGLHDGRLATIGLASLLLLVTTLSNPYYTVFLAVFSVLYLLYQISTATKGLRGALLKRGAWLMACSAFLLLPLVGPAVIREWVDTATYISLADASIWSADLLAFFIPSPMHPLWGRLVRPLYDRMTGNAVEQTLSLGYIVLALMLVALFMAPRKQTRFWLLSAAVFFVLALGPFLHVNGQYLFIPHGIPFFVPLPSLLLHGLPGLKGVQVFSRWEMMLVLSLSILVSYGLTAILERLPTARWGPRAGWAVVGLVSAGILFEFLSVPFPVVEAKIPGVYEAIGRDGARDGSLLELPLDWAISTYSSYQTAHQKKLIVGFVPRPTASLSEYADAVPFIKLFKDPDRLVADTKGNSGDRQDALKVVDLFNLDYIVIHREYLKPETADYLKQFVIETFPIDDIVEEGTLVAFRLKRNHDSTALWSNPRDYRFDFAPPTPGFFVTKGFSPAESGEGRTFAWSTAQESTIWFFLPTTADFTMDLTLLPFVYPSAPQQRMRVFVNERYLGELRLDHDGWWTYSLQLPASLLASGINTIRFAYRYTTAPFHVISGSSDTRPLAVAFDELVLHRLGDFKTGSQHSLDEVRAGPRLD